MCYITAGDVNNVKQHCIKRFFRHPYARQEPKNPTEKQEFGCESVEPVGPWPRSGTPVLRDVLKKREGGSQLGRTSQEVHGGPEGP